MTSVGRFQYGSFALLASFHLGCILGALFLKWSWPSFGLGVVLYLIATVGSSVGNHRYWSHESFQASRRVEYLLAIMGGISGQGTIRQWRRNHLQHHAYADRQGDPHSPWQYANRIRGFWWGYMGWNFWEVLPPQGYQSKETTSPVVSWQDRWYFPIFLSGMLIPWLLFGWSGLWIAGALRFVASLHFTWAIASVGHIIGERPGRIRPTRDHAHNIWLLSPFTGGEGWHFNHHADPRSAIMGPHWYHWDFGKWFIRLMEWCGGVWDVRPFSPPAASETESR